ncbi:MAG: VCBS repeat-containing protein [Myxococcota bacterium]
MPIWGVAATALAAPWEQVAEEPWTSLRQWSNEVEIGDLDGDGDLDVVLANGGDYSDGGSPEPTIVLVNDGLGTFVRLDRPELSGLHRTAKIRDLTGDGAPDLFLPGAWQAPSVLLAGDGFGGLVDASAGLPVDPLSIGDAEAGDVDGDGDLDLVLSDSGPGNALFGQGELTRLWLNDGAGTFTDATAQLPAQAIRWSWDLELADVDLDFDLDLAISCKTCSGSFLFQNDGLGTFVDVSGGLPQRSNNYEFESLDLTADGLPDLVTINDGPGLGERILVNTGAGFADETAARYPFDNGDDDNVAVLLDFEHDGDVDVLIGSLSGDDRVFVNDGAGVFSLDPDVLQGPNTPGTLGMAVGDLDGDARLDVVMCQGEAAEPDGWYRGVDVPVDGLPPVILQVEPLPEPVAFPIAVRAELHDRKTPIGPDDAAVVLGWSTATDGGSIPMDHVGHVVWRGTFDGPTAGQAGTWHVCATDRAGNEACSPDVAFTASGGTTSTDGDADTDADADSDTDADTDTDSDADTDADADADPGADGSGCGCRTGTGGGWWAVALVAVARRRTRRA